MIQIVVREKENSLKEEEKQIEKVQRKNIYGNH